MYYLLGPVLPEIIQEEGLRSFPASREAFRHKEIKYHSSFLYEASTFSTICLINSNA